MGFNCYIHIPFCTSKCKYCHFASFSGFRDLQVEEYVRFLCEEITSDVLLLKNSPLIKGVRGIFQLNGVVLDTIYFGGGTPGILKPEYLERIFETLHRNFEFASDIEITIEANPENITKENLVVWREFGINRVSIGVQTLNKKALEEVGRKTLTPDPSPLGRGEKGDKGDVFEALNVVSSFCGFSVSLDFIIGLPYVERGEVKRDIETLLDKYSFVNHISVYMLEDEKYPKSWKDLGIKEEEYLQEYLEIKDFLESRGFGRYELSNFAKLGFECKHNIGYWKHKNCLAFGLGANGFIGNVRFANSSRFEEYYSGKGRLEEVLTEEELFLEKIMFDLRTDGISKKYLEKLDKKKVEEFIENGYLVDVGDRICLSDKGIGVLDYILGEI